MPSIAPDRASLAIVGALALGAALLVGLSLQSEPPPGYPPTDPAPRDVGAAYHAVPRVTLDASRSDRWVFYDFSRAAVVEDPGPLDWDIAFRRFHVMINGGPRFVGQGAVADLGDIDFHAVTLAPDSGWVDEAGPDSTNAAIGRWYDYGFTSHLLSPKRRVYAIRTADGRYARLRFLSYYCPGAMPGCVSFQYAYQGDGSMLLAPPGPGTAR